MFLNTRLYFVSRWHRGRSEHARCVIGLCIKELFIYLLLIFVNFRKSFASSYLTNLFSSLCKYENSWYDRKLRTPHWPVNFTKIAVLLCKNLAKRIISRATEEGSPSTLPPPLQKKKKKKGRRRRRYCLHIHIIFVIIRTKDPRRRRRSRRPRGRRQRGRRRRRERGRQRRRGRGRGGRGRPRRRSRRRRRRTRNRKGGRRRRLRSGGRRRRNKSEYGGKIFLECKLAFIQTIMVSQVHTYNAIANANANAHASK